MSADYDSPTWRKQRNELLLRAIGDHDAVDFLLDVFQIGETWDDLVDRDKPLTADDIHRAFWLALVELPNNPFYRRHGAALVPVMATMMNAWMDSVPMEQGGTQQRAVAYVLRDAYLEIISLVLYLARGYDAMRVHSAQIRAFLMESHETFDEYMKGATR